MDTAALQFCACSEGRVGGLLAVPRAAPRHRLGLQYGDTDRRLDLDLVTLQNTRAYIRSSVVVGGLPAFQRYRATETPHNTTGLTLDLTLCI